MKAADNMKRALETYQLRNKTYGNNYLHYGKVMKALFPDGIQIKTEHDWNRVGIFFQIMSKLTRYVSHFDQPHLDSIHDIGVYSFMLEEVDAMVTVERIEELVKTANPCEHVFREGRCVACDELDPNYTRHARLVNSCHHVWNNGICLACGDVSKPSFGALSHGAFGLAAQKLQDERCGCDPDVNAYCNKHAPIPCSHSWTCDDPECDGVDCYGEKRCTLCGARQ